MVGKYGRLAGGVHTNRIQYAIFFFVFTVGLYLGLTWFFFGSPHPCGILEARQRPYAIARGRRSQLEDYELLREFGGGMQRKEFDEFAKRIIGADEGALKVLNQRVWRQTPAQCFWQAITWKAPQE